ncbi:MAG: hypothetical protein R3B13_37195 [Polyangiaceae bacterium]
MAIEGKESPSQVRCLVTPWCFSEDALDTDTESIARPASTRDLGETLAALSNAELWTRTLASNARRRRAIALLVAHVAEVERRQLHLREGYSSLYDFCLRGLGMSEGEAHRSISSARVARRFPIAVGMLADGRLHLTGLSLLANRLTESNHAALLEEACGKTKAEIQVVLARWFPRPDVPDQVELLETGDWRGGSNETGTKSAAELDHCGGVRPGFSFASGTQTAAPRLLECVGHESPGFSDGGARDSAMGNARGPAPHDRIEPRSAERFAIRFSASAAFKAKLDHARDLMSHVGRGLETVFERALDLLIAERENKCWGKTDKPRRSAGAKHGAPTRQSKREVYERDAGQCTYVSPAGVHCTARAFLNFDHIKERANGGGGAADNGQLLCAAHNQMRARQTFGDAFMDDRIARRRCRKKALAADLDPVDGTSSAECIQATSHSVECLGDGVSDPSPDAPEGADSGALGASPDVSMCPGEAAEVDVGEARAGESATAMNIRQRRSNTFDDNDGQDATAMNIRQRRSNACDAFGGEQHATAESIRQRRSNAFDDFDGEQHATAGERVGSGSAICRQNPLVNAGIPQCQRGSNAFDDSDGEQHATAMNIRQRRSKPTSVADLPKHASSLDAAALPITPVQQAKLVAALTAMGFRKSECRRAVVELSSCGDALTMDLLIRRALALLVPG